MFISNSDFIKKFVTIICSLVCVIFTIVSIIALIFSSDKKPFYVILPAVITYDVAWALIYTLYISKK